MVRRPDARQHRHNTANGYKTRRFENIRDELEQGFDIHAAAGTRLGGVHLELTGENVTECMGGARDLTEIDLERAYKSSVDPRLNYEQSLELAMMIVHKRGRVQEDQSSRAVDWPQPKPFGVSSRSGRRRVG